MATTNISGKRRRITERNSNPDICGIFRSETMSSGTLVFSCKRASKPSCGCNLVSFNGQRRRDHGANAGIVIDDEYPILRRVEQWCLLAATNTTATKISHLEVGDDGSLSFSIFQCCSKLHTSTKPLPPRDRPRQSPNGEAVTNCLLLLTVYKSGATLL